jgi:hypothetical protein
MSITLRCPVSRELLAGAAVQHRGGARSKHVNRTAVSNCRWIGGCTIAKFEGDLPRPIGKDFELVLILTFIQRIGRFFVSSEIWKPSIICEKLLRSRSRKAFIIPANQKRSVAKLLKYLVTGRFTRYAKSTARCSREDTAFMPLPAHYARPIFEPLRNATATSLRG